MASKSDNVALVRLKAGGRFYEVGETVPEQDDMDNLREQGYVGSASDAKALEKKAADAESKVAELEAKIAELQAELEATQLEQANASANTESVTDAEAAAKAEAESKQIGS